MSQEELWHRKYGHPGVPNIRKLVAEEIVVGFDCKILKDVGVCETCVEGKCSVIQKQLVLQPVYVYQ